MGCMLLCMYHLGIGCTLLDAAIRSSPTWPLIPPQDRAWSMRTDPSEVFGPFSSVMEAWKQDASQAGAQGTDSPARLSEGEHQTPLCSTAQPCHLERACDPDHGTTSAPSGDCRSLHPLLLPQKRHSMVVGKPSFPLPASSRHWCRAACEH